MLLPSLALAQTPVATDLGLLGWFALVTLIILIAGPLAVLGLIVLAFLVARGVLRRHSPWMRVGFRGFRVSFASTTVVAAGLRYAGLLNTRHDLAGIVGLVVASAALFAAYLYMAVAGLRRPGLPGA